MIPFLCRQLRFLVPVKIAVPIMICPRFPRCCCPYTNPIIAVVFTQAIALVAAALIVQSVYAANFTEAILCTNAWDNSLFLVNMVLASWICDCRLHVLSTLIRAVKFARLTRSFVSVCGNNTVRHINSLQNFKSTIDWSECFFRYYFPDVQRCRIYNSLCSQLSSRQAS
jgi:hypothetical protein